MTNDQDNPQATLAANLFTPTRNTITLRTPGSIIGLASHAGVAEWYRMVYIMSSLEQVQQKTDLNMRSMREVVERCATEMEDIKEHQRETGRLHETVKGHQNQISAV